MIAFYVRTSTDKQQSGNEAQILALNTWAATQGIDLAKVKIYNDNGVSGTKEKRPALNSLLDDCRAGEVSKIVVYSFSRFARSTQQLITSLNFFNDKGIDFISITENIDTSTPMGKMIFGVMASLAQFERDMIAERTKTGLANAKAKGKRLGRTNQYNSSRAKELKQQGKSYLEIAKELGCTKSTAHHLVNNQTEKAA